MITIWQGEQFYFAFKIKKDETYITPSNCDDMRCRMFGITKTYSKEELLFNSDTWYYPLTEDQTLSCDEETEIQASWISDGDIWKTPVRKIVVGDSIIKDKWEEE